jgi:hypothetical protein
MVGNFHNPGEVACDHEILGPGAVCRLRVQERQLVDLKPLEFGFVGCYAGSVAVC